ncbi:trifunctional dihydropteroate synthetase [Lambiella insularis]|nr:trifunctional dihydropteroate synthetase [Lambiella insularis]
MLPAPEDQLHVAEFPEYVYLRNLHLSAVIGKDAWGRDLKPQPIILSIRLQKELGAAARGDDVSQTVNYGQVCKTVTSYVEQEQVFPNLLDFAIKIGCIASQRGCAAVLVRAILPKASLRAEGGLGIEIVRFNDGRDEDVSIGKTLLNGLKIPCIIGVNKHERLAKQVVVINLEINDERVAYLLFGNSNRTPQPWTILLGNIITTVENSSYETLEALATKVLEVMFTEKCLNCISISIEKPSALAFVEGAGVHITRTLAEYSRN